MSKRPQNNGMVFDVIFERLDKIDKRLDLLEHDLRKIETLAQDRLKKLEERVLLFDGIWVQKK